MLADRAADELLPFLSDYEIGIRVEVVINNVAIFERDLQAKRVIPVHDIVTQILDRVALGFVVHQRSIEVGVDQKIAHVVFAQQLGIFSSAERAEPPTRASVIGLHPRHSLQ